MVVITGWLLPRLVAKVSNLHVLLGHHKLPSLHQQNAALHSQQHAPCWPITKATGKPNTWQAQTLRVVL